MIKRREFIAGLGSTAAWPVVVRAQQSAMPVIGYLSGRTENSDAQMLVSVRRGLGDVGYFEGRNVRIEYRFADGWYDRMSALLNDLTQQKVSVIVSTAALFGGLLQQIRSSPIPIVFIGATDPVRWGLAASMNRPGGNLTGVYTMNAELLGKQWGLLHDLVPKAATIAMLFDPSQQSGGPITLPDARNAAATLALSRAGRGIARLPSFGPIRYQPQSYMGIAAPGFKWSLRAAKDG